MKKILTLILFLLIFNTITAQSVLGKWHTLDPKTQKVESTINIFLKNDKLYAQIIDLANLADKDKLCTNCKGKTKNQPILGMIILFGLTKDKDEWNGGKILDPKSGKIYKCYITLKDKNTLKLRGYIGFSLLGRTELWYRKNI